MVHLIIDVRYDIVLVVEVPESSVVHYKVHLCAAVFLQLKCKVTMPIDFTTTCRYVTWFAAFASFPAVSNGGWEHAAAEDYTKEGLPQCARYMLPTLNEDG